MSRQYMYKTWGSMNNEPDLKMKTVQETMQNNEQTNTKIIPLKDANHLKFALKSNRFVIVKAEADWCQPCKMLKKPFEDLAEKCESTGLFAYFTDDIDRNGSVHATKVEAVPTFFVYTDGDIEPKKKYQGDFKQLENLIEKILDRINESGNSNNELSSNTQHDDTNQPTLMGQSNHLNPSVVQKPQNNFDKTLNHFSQSLDLSQNNFIPSKEFVGSKPGYVFKNDSQGIGYYKDK